MSNTEFKPGDVVESDLYGTGKIRIGIVVIIAEHKKDWAQSMKYPIPVALDSTGYYIMHAAHELRKLTEEEAAIAALRGDLKAIKLNHDTYT